MKSVGHYAERVYLAMYEMSGGEKKLVEVVDYVYDPTWTCEQYVALAERRMYIGAVEAEMFTSSQARKLGLDPEFDGIEIRYTRSGRLIIASL